MFSVADTLLPTPHRRTSIAVVLAWPPTSDNVGWPTSLPYYLLRQAPDELDIHLFYFRGSETQQEMWARDRARLRLASATELPPYWTRWESWLGSWGKASKEGFPTQMDWFPPRERFLNAIHETAPDMVWLYPHWLSKWVPKLEAERVVVTGPDSAVLHQERAIRLGRWRSVAELDGEVASLRSATVLEEFLVSSKARIHVVGLDDARRYNAMAQCERATYTVHPHYDIAPHLRELSSLEGKIKILVNGNANTVYMGDHALQIVENLKRMASSLRERVALSFVGKNWEGMAAGLTASGYSVDHRQWVESFAAELAQHDVMLCPYAVGAGTKGKVLHAMATGLLAIGSDIAFENIDAGERGFLKYEVPEEVGEILVGVADGRAEAAETARRGCEAVRDRHSPIRAGEVFWNYLLDSGGSARSG